ncbi:MAG: betaine/proline/choline family ABC transporter ATP-binding protein [Clostridiaceae bacterium]|nr:betaine/proline/choline family ABC transporter ATP-binding protein [Clostridiaceae bacterium]
MIDFQNVRKSYDDTKVLKGINLNIKDGEFAVLIGPSGCGKTTTLKTINRLIEPDSGKIYIDGQDISTFDPVKLRRSVGYVIQQIGLFPNMTVEENIGIVPKLLKYEEKEIDKIVHEMLEIAEMDYDEYAHKYPYEMSGGQQQRVGVLRALAASPPIVLMDEPFGALDPVTRTTLQNEIVELQKKLKKTIVFVTHDMDEAIKIADNIVFMDEGEIIQVASPEEMLTNPKNDLIRSFMGDRSSDIENQPQVVDDFMYTNISTAYPDYSFKKAIGLMARKKVDTLIVKDRDETFLGVVMIKDINHKLKSGEKSTIGSLIRTDIPTAYSNTNAEESFNELMESEYDYIVVLRANNTLAGIVTQTNIAKSLANAVWGE